MKVLTWIPADSYPVGLDVSKDGRYVFTTSQGHTNGGGNCVDIFEVKQTGGFLDRILKGMEGKLKGK